MNNASLVLGAAQLGMDYGIANTAGKPTFATALETVRLAVDNGIFDFDTAQGYGDSEQVLGKCFAALGCNGSARVVSKVGVCDAQTPYEELEASLNLSLSQLQQSALHTLLLHREDSVDSLDDGLGAKLGALKSDGLVSHVGVSVYSPERARQVLEHPLLDAVQIPSSIFDRRFEQADIFSLAESLGKRVYVRSVFLQGLFFFTEETLPKHMAYVAPYIGRLQKFLAAWKMDAATLALAYAKAVYSNAKILIGVDSPEQLSGNLTAWNSAISAECIGAVRKEFADVPVAVLNPALWPQQG